MRNNVTGGSSVRPVAMHRLVLTVLWHAYRIRTKFYKTCQEHVLRVSGGDAYRGMNPLVETEGQQTLRLLSHSGQA